jgi:hypothetical protein
MKKLIALSFLLFLIGCGKEVDILRNRNGLKFEIYGQLLIQENSKKIMPLVS